MDTFIDLTNTFISGINSNCYSSMPIPGVLQDGLKESSQWVSVE